MYDVITLINLQAARKEKQEGERERERKGKERKGDQV